MIADFNLYQVDGDAQPRHFYIADIPNSSHEIILGMPFINDFQLTPFWQPNVLLPSLRVNINGITSTIWTFQTADNQVEDVISSKIAKHNGRFRKVFMIKWKNYSADANTREPLCNQCRAQEACENR